MGDQGVCHTNIEKFYRRTGFKDQKTHHEDNREFFADFKINSAKYELLMGEEIYLRKIKGLEFFAHCERN